MLAAAVCAASQFLLVTFVAIVRIAFPPRNPFPERVIVAIRRREIRGRRMHFPLHFRVLQSAARKIIRRDTHVRVIANEQRPFALQFGVDFEFRPAKFLHLKRVRELFVVESFHRAVRFEFDLGIPKIDVLRKL